MNKRGQTRQVYLVGEFVLVALLVFMLSGLMGQTSNQSLIEKAVTAEDVARTIEIAQATTHDFRYEYPESLDGYTVIIDNFAVSLVEDGEEPPASDFSFNKRYFTVREGISVPKEQGIDVASFDIIKKGDEDKLEDYTS